MDLYPDIILYDKQVLFITLYLQVKKKWYHEKTRF